MGNNVQIELHTNLEERLPSWFVKKVDQISVKEFPNKCYKGKVTQTQTRTQDECLFVQTVPEAA